MMHKKELLTNYTVAKHLKEYLDKGGDVAIVPLDSSGLVIKIDNKDPIYMILKMKIDGFTAMAEAFVKQVEEK